MMYYALTLCRSNYELYDATDSVSTLTLELSQHSIPSDLEG